MGHDHRFSHSDQQISDRGIGDQQRLNRKIVDLQQQWVLLNEKLNELNKQLILENRVEEKLRLKKLIDDTKTQCDQFEEQLKDMESQLAKIDSDAKEVAGRNNDQGPIVDFSYWDKVEDFQLDDIIFLWIGGVRDVATARQAIDLGLRLAMAVVDNKLPCSNFISIPPKGLATLVYSKANIAQSCLSWRIKRNDLKVWCESKGYKPAFLFPEVRNTRSEATELLDPDSPTYPLELHIALRAWEMVSANHSPKKSPKQQILAWLNAHYPDLSEEAKNRIATIANWKKQGGAPSPE